MSVEHYENFPVASWLCPAELRPPITAIYRFARTADDIADEGDAGTLAGVGLKYAVYRNAVKETGHPEPGCPCCRRDPGSLDMGGRRHSRGWRNW